jgi:5-methylcytosine-specific restriction endonuclease McrA
MPIDYKDYHENWQAIRKSILRRAKNRCELCNAENKKPHWRTGSKVVLTVHHINFNKKDNRGINLIALCQRCHLRLDAPNRTQKIKRKKNETQK